MKKIILIILLFISMIGYNQTIIESETDSINVYTTNSSNEFDLKHPMKLYTASIKLFIYDDKLIIRYKSNKKSQHFNSFTYFFNEKIDENNSFTIKSHDTLGDNCTIIYEKNERISIKYNKLLLMVLNLDD